MVTETALRPTQLQTLRHQLQAAIYDYEIDLSIQCAIKDKRLIVLGQHNLEATLDSHQTLRSLERAIQSLQLKFIQQVRLYLRISGEDQPYAKRQFRIQPPAPPPNPFLCAADRLEPAKPQEEWLVGDEELNALVHELWLTTPSQDLESTAFLKAAIASDSSPIALVDDRTTPAEPAIVPGFRFDFSQWTPDLSHRRVLTTGVAALGVASGIYGLTRPCVLGTTCVELQTAETLHQQFAETSRSAKTEDLQAAQDDLRQAVSLLETIPVWSGRSSEAQSLLQRYEAQSAIVSQILAAESLATSALEKSQTAPHAVATWQEIRSVWEEAIAQLKSLNLEQASDLNAVVQQQMQTYETHLDRVKQLQQQEQQAHQSLDIAQQTIQLAEARQKIARSVPNWQLVRATWQIALVRLQEIPPQTTAAVSAQRLIANARSQISTANDRIQQEQVAANVLHQANEQALLAQAAEQRYDWQQAITHWSNAITFAEQVSSTSSQAVEAATRLPNYTTARTQAEQNIQATRQIETELQTTCNSQLKVCSLIEIDAAIKVQLVPGYVEAITTARNSGDRNLQAIVTDHQLNLRRALERIATTFKLPVEVYDPSNQLLDRHTPQSN